MNTRKITLFTGQWTDMPLETLAAKAASWGYEGLELASSPAHFDIEKVLNDAAYVENLRLTLQKNKLSCIAISNHLEGQLVSDPNDSRSDAFVPSSLKGKSSEEKSAWAQTRMKLTAKAASLFGATVVTGFTGSPIWNSVYPWPPVSPDTVNKGYAKFASDWSPILDEFTHYNVKFALEVHPTEIAYDLYTAKRALEAVNHHPAFGFNFDPSHLYWQLVDPVQFIYEFPDRIFHVHVKDAERRLDGRTSILSSHLPFGDPNRGWDFRSPGYGKIDFKAIFRALNDIRYSGPLSVEWEDAGMDREFGARDAYSFVKRTDFPASYASFEAGFKR